MRMKRFAALLLSGILAFSSASAAFAQEPDKSVPVMEESVIEEPVIEESVIKEEVIEEAVVEEIAEEEISEEEISEEAVAEESNTEEAVTEEEIAEEVTIEEEIIEEEIIEEETSGEIINEEPGYFEWTFETDVYANPGETVFIPANFTVDDEWNYTYLDEFIMSVDLEAGKAYKLSYECNDQIMFSLYDPDYNNIDVYLPDGFIPAVSGTYHINISATVDSTVVLERKLTPVSVQLVRDPFDTSFYKGIEYPFMEGLKFEIVYEDASVVECEAFDENWVNVVAGWYLYDEVSDSWIDESNIVPGNYYFRINIAYTGQEFFIPFEVKDMAAIPTLSLNETVEVKANSFFLSEDSWFVGDPEYFAINVEEGKEYLFTGANTYFSVFTLEEDGSRIYYDCDCCEYRYYAEETKQVYVEVSSMLDDVITFTIAPERVVFTSATAWLDTCEFEYGTDPAPEGLHAEVYYSNGDMRTLDIPYGFDLEVLESMGICGWTVFGEDGQTYADELRDSKGNLPAGEYYFGLMLEETCEYSILCNFTIKEAPKPVKPCCFNPAPIVKAVVKVVQKQICSIVSSILRWLF